MYCTCIYISFNCCQEKFYITVHKFSFIFKLSNDSLCTIFGDIFSKFIRSIFNSSPFLKKPVVPDAPYYIGIIRSNKLLNACKQK